MYYGINKFEISPHQCKMGEKEEVKRLEKLIKEDNVEELSNILNLNENLRTNFNNFLSSFDSLPLLLLSVQLNAQKVVEYLLSQDFVDKSIISYRDENIYHVVCRIRGGDKFFSIIERKVPHNLILNSSCYYSDEGMNAFHYACELNNIFIVKRVHEILESLQVDLIHIKNNSRDYAVRNKDIEVIKYILSIVQINDEVLFDAIENFKIDIVVYLLNVYLCQSIPSHLHNQFHIIQFSNLNPSNKNIY